MSNPYTKLARAQEDYANKFGEHCTLGRVGTASLAADPDYSVLDQTPNVVYSGKFYIETSTHRFIMVDAPDVEVFVINGKRSILKPGDILHKTGVTPYPSTTPDVTFVTQLPIGTCFGIKTDRIADIYNGDDLIFQNVQFSYLGRASFPGSALDREIKVSMNIPSVQVALFRRPLRTDTREAEGLLFKQTDVSPEVVWEIANVTDLGDIHIYDLKRNVYR